MTGALFTQSLDRAHHFRAGGRFSRLEELRLRKHIEGNIRRQISLRELAAIVDLSRSHFGRMFKKSFETTPYQFVLGHRMDIAKELLAKTEKQVSEIAADVGFASETQFATAFCHREKLTPSEFRHAAQAGDREPSARRRPIVRQPGAARCDAVGEHEQLYIQMLYCRSDAGSLHLDLIHYFLNMACLSLEAGIRAGEPGTSHGSPNPA